ncbi:SpaH/EbpB family LPXTG-anchored major pilin [Enterococcus sp. CSURQ0835]|uniref:SpaH/EbpB family LPXTG-anchored major pilin n=1 Tax=Enterococcus sp. CSURQ0835 TaxID=2681394 RepID=UPI0013586755|nr:SpaH/EbpB family LPXTG-anchored major pilin [Enterococcus sp. CSURQ0835]
MKKIIQLFAILFMVGSTLLGAAMGASAANDSLAPDRGSLTIHKYMYDEKGVPGGIANGKEITNQDVLNELTQPIENVPFDVYQITGPEGSAPAQVPGNAGLSSLKWIYSLDNGKLKVTNGTDTYYYTLGTVKEGKTEADGSLKFDNLNRGQYFVVENLSKITDSPKVNGVEVSITKPVNPFVVDVPMTDPENYEKWITDVHVYPKNQSTEVVKTPEAPSYDVGKIVKWKIDVELPSDIKDYKQLTITDKLDEALTYIDSSVVIYKAEKDSNGNWIKSTPEEKLTIGNFISNLNGNTIKIDITSSGFAALDGWEGMIVEFETRINEKIYDKIAAGGGNVNIVENKVNVEFTDENDVVTDKDSEETEVNIGEIEPNKVDEKDGGLAGAEFQIADTEANAKAKNYLKVEVNSEGKITRIVRPGEAGYDTAIPWIVRTGLNSPVDDGGQWYFPTFRGMVSHADDATKTPLSYWLVETKAPKDYNLLGNPIKVTFKEYDESKTVQHILKTDKIVNKRGFELPKTGSWLTILLTILGIVMLGLGIMSSMNKKKDKKA